MNTELAKELYSDIQKNRELISKAESLNLILSNPHFKKIFINDFSNQNVLKLNNELADCSEDRRIKIHEELLAISYFNKFINVTLSNGELAKQSNVEAELALTQE